MKRQVKHKKEWFNQELISLRRSNLYLTEELYESQLTNESLSIELQHCQESNLNILEELQACQTANRILRNELTRLETTLLAKVQMLEYVLRENGSLKVEIKQTNDSFPRRKSSLETTLETIEECSSSTTETNLKCDNKFAEQVEHDDSFKFSREDSSSGYDTFSETDDSDIA